MHTSFTLVAPIPITDELKDLSLNSHVGMKYMLNWIYESMRNVMLTYLKSKNLIKGDASIGLVVNFHNTPHLSYYNEESYLHTYETIVDTTLINVEEFTYRTAMCMVVCDPKTATEVSKGMVDNLHHTFNITFGVVIWPNRIKNGFAIRLVSLKPTPQNTSNVPRPEPLPFDESLAPQVVNIVLKHKHGSEVEYVFRDTHDGRFEATIDVPSLMKTFSAIGKTKKEAKQMVAILICRELDRIGSLRPNIPKAFLR